MNRISELRKETNTSQAELAKLLGVTRQAISLYEKWPDKGGREPKIDTWEKLANFFGVSVPYIQGLNYPRTDEEFFEKLDNQTNQMLNHYNNSEKDEIYKNWNIYFASL
ncbi:MAG: helix-turn-helix transcriptional regulator, partial [Leuconostoc mesenteroides]